MVDPLRSTVAHHHLTAELRDRVVLYVLNEMQPDEATGFEAHLARCKPCREESARLKPILGERLVAAESTPPPGLKQRVLAQACEQKLALHRAAELRWHASGVPGVEFSQLWIDTPNERHTLLIRMAPGATLPNHRHGGHEECYVAEGDLSDGEIQLGAGDYVRYAPGSEHAPSTRSGCLLHVTASLHDERVESPAL